MQGSTASPRCDAGPTHPLLALRRHETVGLCDRLALVPVHDPSNEDPRFLRTRIRSELVPLCSAIAGRDVVPVLARQAEVLAGDADVLGAVASLVGADDRRALGAAPDPVARRAVRAWLAGDGPHPPPLAAVERVLAVARCAQRATQVPGGRRVERRDGRLLLAAEGTPGVDQDVAPVPSLRDHQG